MQYTIVQVINNNTILAAADADDADPVILMSKGIGFGAKKGRLISDVGRDHQIYKLWTTPGEPAAAYDQEQLAAAVQECAAYIGQVTGLDPGALYPALLDHIAFAADRAAFGLGLDNPLQNEIPVLYATEFTLGKECTDRIGAELGLELGDAEACYIAMHIRAALLGRPIAAEMRDAYAYTTIINRLEERFPGAEKKAFLLALAELVEGVAEGRAVHMPALAALRVEIPDSFRIAGEVAAVVAEHRQIRLDDGALGFVAVEIERLRQLHQPIRTKEEFPYA